MKEVDFVPAWYRAVQRRRRDLAVRISSLCVLVAAMAVWSVRNLAVVHAAETDLAAVRESYDLQSAPLARIEELREKMQDLQERQTLLSCVRGGARVDQILAELTRLMPQALVLADVGIVQPDRTQAPLASDAANTNTGDSVSELGRVEIMGFAGSSAEVGSFHTALVESPCFEDVQMSYCRPAVHRNRKGREFLLTARLPLFD